MAKRLRIGYNGDYADKGMDARRKRAIAIAAKIRAKYPYSEYGRSYTKRGSAESLQVFGPSYREANAEQRAHRKHYGYVGRGAYSARKLRRDYETVMGKSLSRAISRKLTGAVNALPFGRGLYSGRGSYTNNLIANGTGAIPIMTGAKDETGAITIAHTEYVCDVFGPTTNFENLSFNLNPGLESTFPWLSQIAQNFEEFEFIQLLFHYTSTITDIGSTSGGQCGTVTMATDYNAAHKPFSDKAEMLGYAHSYSCKTSESMDHGVECDPSKNAGSKANYIRSYPLSSGEDIKTYDHGIFQLAITNCPSSLQNASLGELRVTYKVVLRKPKLFSARGLGISRDFFVTENKTNTNGCGDLITPGTIIYQGVNNSIGCKILTPGGKIRLVFPDFYTGHVRVTTIVRFITGVGAAAFNPPLPTVYSGNIIAIKEIYGQDGQPTPYFKSTELAAGGSSAINNDFVIISHWFIRASTGGVDNVIEQIGQTGGTGYVQTFINVEEYNSYDKTDGEAMNNLVNPTTGVIVAGNAT